MKFIATEKRIKFLAACRDGKALATRTDMRRAHRIYHFIISGVWGNFDTQADALEVEGLIKCGAHTDGQWGPRKVELTEKGEELLKKYKI